MTVEQAAAIVANGGTVDFEEICWTSHGGQCKSIVSEWEYDRDKEPDFDEETYTLYRDGEQVVTMVPHDSNFGAIWQAAIIAAMQTR